MNGGVSNSNAFENMAAARSSGVLQISEEPRPTTSGGTIDTATVTGGALNNSGAITATVLNSAIFANMTGGTVGGLLTNTATGTATNSGALNAGVSNSNAFENMSGGTVVGGLTNLAGTATNDSGGTIDTANVKAGALNNSGAITGRFRTRRPSRT